MTPLSLRLKGFRGIRDGLGLDEVVLDLASLPADAQLIAISGANGKGKTTLMDNLHPYTVMPSRAGADGLGAFSYYDHLCAAEAQKDLIWEHEGRRFRSHLIWRIGGKRKAEAYLFETLSKTPIGNGIGAEKWTPVRLADGTVSDGKMDTYERCVEALLGSAQTFFTSVFSAQGKRQISALRNGEVKSLLADLLGLEDIRAMGQRAGETARLLKAGMLALRQEQATLEAEQKQAQQTLSALDRAAERAGQAQQAKQAASVELTQAQSTLAQVTAERDAAGSHSLRRAQLMAERAEAERAEAAAHAAQREAIQLETRRLAQIDDRAKQRAQQSGERSRAIQARATQLQALLRDAGRIAWACRRLPLAQRVVQSWQERRQHWAQQHENLKAVQARQQSLAQRIESIEREVGQATLRVSDLNRRLGLSQAVPCAGTDLQGQCQLLADAREAQQLKPSADASIERLALERAQALGDRQSVLAAIGALTDAPQQLAYADHRLALASSRAQALLALGQRRQALDQARTDLVALDQECEQIQRHESEAAAGEARDKQQVQEALARIEAQAQERTARHAAQLSRIDADLAALPPAFDVARLTQASIRLDEAAKALSAAEAAHAQALADCQAKELTQAQVDRLGRQLQALDGRLARVDGELASWTLLAKALSHDGVIALCIDDAGPALAGLANELLLACYGARFTVSIHTLVETAKGQAREGFDILVHDAESGQGKSVALMSGGERVWISCRARHEIHYAETPDMPSSRPGQRPRSCNCAIGTCEAMRHNPSGLGSMSLDARGSKSLSLMSGGERTFIDACLTRAIALYLAQSTGRRFDTLFSDEADGPLDPEHKRMFMAMKREVLRIGGYQREFFITQSPHLAEMADAIIDLDAMSADAHSRVALIAEQDGM